MKQFFKDRPCLSILCIEREAGIPKKTLEHYLKGRRELNQQHKEKLIPVLEKYGYKNDDDDRN